MIHGRQHGVSLIEALVAMGVMAFGMLAVVGLQVTLRTNGDVSKQRAEAVRIAQQSIEDWRAFVAFEATPGLDYQDLVSGALPDFVGINATYARNRTITVWPGGSPPMKTLAVAVSWDDRNGQTQTVQLNSVIAGVAPELAGSLAVPANGVAGRQPQSRHRGIPALAKDLGNGTSAIKPPGAPGDVAWRFDNLTGLITLCAVDPLVVLQTSALTLANLVCGGQNALGVSGFVRYALGPAQPLEADARNPTSGPDNSLAVLITRSDGGLAPICYVQPVVVPSPYTLYNCAVPVTVIPPNPTPGWSGSVSFTVVPAANMAAVLTENSASKIKVCSYANPGAMVGNAAFSGGGNSITLTPRAGGSFRAWAAGSRIDLYYGDWTYAHTVGAAVAIPAAGQASQTVPVVAALPGVGAGLNALAFADVWPYANVAVPLFNNNYLVIRAGDGGVAPAGSEVAFSCPVSTVAHQPS